MNFNLVGGQLKAVRLILTNRLKNFILFLMELTQEQVNYLLFL